MSKTYRLLIRRGTAAEWASINPVLAAGELGLETDSNKLKAGNGTVTWNSLPYLVSGGGGGGSGSTWYDGSGAPSNGLGVDGDYYLNTANADIYNKVSSSWVIIMNIKGPQGPPGAGGGGGGNSYFPGGWA